jgi:hypothetical protein
MTPLRYSTVQAALAVSHEDGASLSEGDSNVGITGSTWKFHPTFTCYGVLQVHALSARSNVTFFHTKYDSQHLRKSGYRVLFYTTARGMLSIWLARDGQTDTIVTIRNHVRRFHVLP